MTRLQKSAAVKCVMHGDAGWLLAWPANGDAVYDEKPEWAALGPRMLERAGGWMELARGMMKSHQKMWSPVAVSVSESKYLEAPGNRQARRGPRLFLCLFSFQARKAQIM